MANTIPVYIKQIIIHPALMKENSVNYETEHGTLTSLSSFIDYILAQSNIIEECTSKFEALSIFEPPY